MRLVTVATFTFPAEAHLAKALLESEGILCRLANEHFVNAFGPVDGVQVQVPQDSVEMAREILNEVEPPKECSGDSTKVVAVAAFDNPLDAHAAASALDDAELPHSIVGEGAFGAGRKISLLVPEQVVDKARAVLRGQ